MSALFSTTVSVTGGREGKATSADGRFTQVLSLPKELGGPGGDGTNPEQLFAAGYAACFESALRLVARLQKTAVSNVHITATVTLSKTADGKFQLGVDLLGKIEGVTPEVARGLMDAAHAVCPYSQATRGNIEVTLRTE
ncbi:MAG: organic hydroperoxide resistance protein [Polyangiaceae bacterium]|nr:organic hydroperoxide resistance protein [Polyangiaceae bacterium]